MGSQRFRRKKETLTVLFAGADWAGSTNRYGAGTSALGCRSGRNVCIHLIRSAIFARQGCMVSSHTVIKPKQPLKSLCNFCQARLYGKLAYRYKTQTTDGIVLQFLPSFFEKSVDQGIPTRMPRHNKCLSGTLSCRYGRRYWYIRLHPSAVVSVW